MGLEWEKSLSMVKSPLIDIILSHEKIRWAPELTELFESEDINYMLSGHTILYWCLLALNNINRYSNKRNYNMVTGIYEKLITWPGIDLLLSENISDIIFETYYDDKEIIELSLRAGWNPNYASI